MSGKANSSAPEIVIIRRHSGEDVAAHKGGAWKIAYADFVTAMMAFFLVMWLINAANEATRAQVASYFNPIKLTDSTTADRGLNDPKDAKTKARQRATTGNADKASDADKAQEQKALADPAKTLDKIAMAAAVVTTPATGIANVVAVIKPAVSDMAGAPKVPSDPFDPLTWQSAENADRPPASLDIPKPELNATSSTPKKQVADGEKKTQGVVTVDPPADKSESATKSSTARWRVTSGAEGMQGRTVTVAPPDRPSVPAPHAESQKPEAAPQMPTPVPAAHENDKSTQAAPESSPVAARGVARDAQTKAQEAASAAIKSEILKRMGMDPDELPANIDVKMTPEGQLISLTDRTAFGMFQLGSAQPDARVVQLVAAIATVLKDRPGYIVIRGHTDSRPYRNLHYDNWQLSSARAQMAYYMLLRGGLDDRRVRRIEGLADRDPLIPEHPDAPENRRIDILLGQD